MHAQLSEQALDVLPNAPAEDINPPPLAAADPVLGPAVGPAPAAAIDPGQTANYRGQQQRMDDDNQLMETFFAHCTTAVQQTRAFLDMTEAILQNKQVSHTEASFLDFLVRKYKEAAMQQQQATGQQQLHPCSMDNIQP